MIGKRSKIPEFRSRTKRNPDRINNRGLFDAVTGLQDARKTAAALLKIARKAAPALTAKARELVDYIGLPATLRLVAEYGGQTLAIPKGTRERGQEIIAELGQAIGETAARKLAASYGGEYLYVPMCKPGLTALRDTELQARFDAMTSKAGGMTARTAVNRLVKEFGVTGSTVWRALKRPTTPSPRTTP